jgi:alanine dehydrogenase
MKADPGLLEGLNTYQGEITYKAVADSQGRKFKEAASALEELRGFSAQL